MGQRPAPHDDLDLDYTNDPGIADHEILWRGLKVRQFVKTSLGGWDVSSAAFKTRQRDGVRRHISTYRKSLGIGELDKIWKRLPQSKALCGVEAGTARVHYPKVVGVCDARGLASHTRIIRNRAVNDDDWEEVAILLAYSARVSEFPPSSASV